MAAQQLFFSVFMLIILAILVSMNKIQKNFLDAIYEYGQ